MSQDTVGIYDVAVLQRYYLRDCNERETALDCCLSDLCLSCLFVVRVRVGGFVVWCTFVLEARVIGVLCSVIRNL